MSLNVDAWDDLVEYLPADWEEIALKTNAMKGLKKDKSAKNLLRTLFIHFACGCSLKETVSRAKAAGIADLSSIAMFKRVIKCKDWLQSMCCNMLMERNLSKSKFSARLRLIDGCDVSEPGETGSRWRIHYSVSMPDAICDQFEITPVKGAGTGESLCRFEVKSGDILVADRGYSRAKDIAYVVEKGGDICVRLNYTSLPLLSSKGAAFPLVQSLKKLNRPGDCAEWDVQIHDKDADRLMKGRICAVRKSPEAIRRAHKRCAGKAQKNHNNLSAKNLFVNEYVIVFTTLEKEQYPLAEILKIYRLRWQVELVFKRFKSLANLGHLPKQLAESSKAWLYGKLLVALLIEKIIASGGELSPWRDASDGEAEPLEGVRFCVENSSVNHPSKLESEMAHIELA